MGYGWTSLSPLHVYRTSKGIFALEWIKRLPTGACCRLSLPASAIFTGYHRIQKFP